MLRYFGADASKYISYSVASVSGVLLAVCSCTVLPLFAGIYKRGAGIGPATTFLFSAPAINLLAMLLAGPALSLPNMIVINRVLGFKRGIKNETTCTRNRTASF